MKFPDTLEDFHALIQSLNIVSPSDWTYKDEYSRADVVQFLFLWSIWQYIGSFDAEKYSAEQMKLIRERVSRLGIAHFEPTVPIIEKFLGLGATPEEISDLVQFELACFAQNICYHLEDNNSCTNMSIKDERKNSAGLFLMEGDDEGCERPTQGLWSMHELLNSARPKSILDRLLT